MVFLIKLLFVKIIYKINERLSIYPQNKLYFTSLHSIIIVKK